MLVILSKRFCLALIFLFFTQSTLFSMSTKDHQILDCEGRPIELKGINWFGFNNQSTMVDGLWGGPDPLSYDFATVVHRMKLLGFNAVRLPFSFTDLYEISPRNYSQNGKAPSLSEIQKSLIPPAKKGQVHQTISLLPFPPERKVGMINDYLPKDSTFQRFLWVVNFFARNGFYVLIDNHLREDQSVLKDPENWIQQWVTLATAIAEDPISKERVMLDLLNEPDNFGIRWETTSQRPGLKDLYISVMDALHHIHPGFLFFIEGTGQAGINANWGDGFCTNAHLIAKHGLSDPTPFFNEVLQKPYLHQIVISPHIYPPSVTSADQAYTGKALWKRLSDSFGYLTMEGYQKKVFPIAVGEFGSRFTSEKDIQSMNDTAHYFNQDGEADDQRHQHITSWFYWSWNANSGDTGGIVQDNWKDIHWQKIDYLTEIGLCPWYSEDKD